MHSSSVIEDLELSLGIATYRATMGDEYFATADPESHQAHGNSRYHDNYIQASKDYLHLY